MPTEPLARIPGVLILEGNAARLRREGHSKIGDEIVRMFAPSVADGTMRVTRVPLRTAFDVGFWTGIAGSVRYDAIVLIAHGSPSVVEAADGVALEWADVAARLAKTGAAHMLAIACFGATSVATDRLFAGMPTLNRIVGSPAPITINQARPALLELAVAARGASLPVEWSVGVSMLGAALTKGVLFVRTREGLSSSTSGDRLLEDLIGLGAWALLQSNGSDDDLRP